eukprot:COSAG06_NODE_43_length_29826_cov_32.009621_29_plen_175_part_00
MLPTPARQCHLWLDQQKDKRDAAGQILPDHAVYRLLRPACSGSGTARSHARGHARAYSAKPRGRDDLGQRWETPLRAAPRRTAPACGRHLGPRPPAAHLCGCPLHRGHVRASADGLHRASRRTRRGHRPELSRGEHRVLVAGSPTAAVSPQSRRNNRWAHLRDSSPHTMRYSSS